MLQIWIWHFSAHFQTHSVAGGRVNQGQVGKNKNKGEDGLTD